MTSDRLAAGFARRLLLGEPMTDYTTGNLPAVPEIVDAEIVPAGEASGPVQPYPAPGPSVLDKDGRAPGSPVIHAQHVSVYYVTGDVRAAGPRVRSSARGRNVIAHSRVDDAHLAYGPAAVPGRGFLALRWLFAKPARAGVLLVLVLLVLVTWGPL